MAAPAVEVHLVRSTRLFPDAPYAYAARAHRPDLIFTAGACPLDEHGHVVGPADVRAQMRQALANLQVALEESGATIRDVVKTTVYVASGVREDPGTWCSGRDPMSLLALPWLREGKPPRCRVARCSCYRIAPSTTALTSW